MISFQAALAMGIGFLECDVRLTKDREVVVIHDRKVDRTTDGEGYVWEFTLKKIRELDAGSWFSSKYSSERIPGLTEVFSIIKNNEIIVEIKDGIFFPEIIDRVLLLIREHDLVNNVNVSSFHWELLGEIKKKEPGLKTSALALCSSNPFKKRRVIDGKGVKIYSDVEELISDAGRYKADIICPPAEFVSEINVKEMHDEGFLIRAWGLKTYPDKGEMERLIRCDVDGMTTNYPDVLKMVYKDLAGEV